ncbi:Non-specific serine/threonine protein kinase [Bertholletia excelsa]
MTLKLCFALGFLCCFILAVTVDAQDQSGFINIDCGLPEGSNSTDDTTGLTYTSDAGLIDSGRSMSIASSYQTSFLAKQFYNLRSFPDGTRNCYTLRPPQGKNHSYIIRAWFSYGNYDNKNQQLAFDLELDLDYWDTVNIMFSFGTTSKEIIHVPSSDYVYLCLINTGHGIPFISVLEMRPLPLELYMNFTSYGSLNLDTRSNFASFATPTVRYKDDIYDRVWVPDQEYNSSTISTSSAIKPDSFRLPPTVMSTANTNNSFDFYWLPLNDSVQYFFFWHFAELELLRSNQIREFNMYINDELWEPPFRPEYLRSTTIYNALPKTSSASYKFSIRRTNNSTLPAIINALEVYKVIQLGQVKTDEQDVAAMKNIKSKYGLKISSWQADPCVPQEYKWDGLDCIYNSSNPPRIISLNLSSSGLTGEIDPSFSNLTLLQYLDLSMNNLTGQVPDSLSQLTFLRILNLRGNNFIGPLPEALLEKSKKGQLLLSVDDGSVATATNPSPTAPRKKSKFVVPVVASAAALLVLIVISAFTLCYITRKGKQVVGNNPDLQSNQPDGSLELKNPKFTYLEVLRITNNFERVIGRGGFGTVYHGYVGGSQVAVKMLSSSSTQGYKEFQAEAKLLMSVHHRNLTSLVGYCYEGAHMGLIYEYMANGSLDRHLSATNPLLLSWEEKLQTLTDAAQGLEYLHHGCKPPIIHRDIKCTNILLDEKFQAKLADFGLSRVAPVEGGTHVSTIVAGTPGYLDPEYFQSNWLTEKSDVYSFGIVLLEMIAGRFVLPRSPEDVHIIPWVESMVAKGDINGIVDPRLQGGFDANSVWKAVELAISCVSLSSAQRPTMNYVVAELKECLAMESAHSHPDMDSDSGDATGVMMKMWMLIEINSPTEGLFGS